MTIHPKLKLSAVSIAVVLAGCSSTSMNQKSTQVNTSQESSTARVSAFQADLQKQVEQRAAANSIREKTDSPFFSTTEKATSGIRPPALDKRVDIKVAENMSLSTVVSLLSQMSGMPIRLEADVGVEAGQEKLRPAFSGRLDDVVKQIAGSMNLSTRLEDDSMVIYRTETRVFRSKRSVGSFKTITNIGVLGASSTQGNNTGASGNSTIASSVSGESSFDPWKELAASIAAALTPAGKVNVMQANGTIVVTDTPAGINRAEKIIDIDNRLASHPILVKLEVISVQDNTADDYGVNWTYLFERARGFNLNFVSPGALSQGSVGAFRATKVGGPSNNSDFLISALSDRGKTHTLLRREFQSFHNVPASIARTSSRAYRARVTPSGVASSSGATEPGVEPGSVTTGIKLFVTPTWTGNDEYTITVTYDDSFLKTLAQLGTGKQTIDAPEVDSTQSFNIAQVRTGYTAVLNTLEIDEDSYNTRGLSSSITTGQGSGGKKLRFFMLLTVVQGPF